MRTNIPWAFLSTLPRGCLSSLQQTLSAQGATYLKSCLEPQRIGVIKAETYLFYSIFFSMKFLSCNVVPFVLPVASVLWDVLIWFKNSLLLITGSIDTIIISCLFLLFSQDKTCRKYSLDISWESLSTYILSANNIIQITCCLLFRVLCYFLFWGFSSWTSLPSLSCIQSHFTPV